jgi:hypothetical protein
MTEQHPITPPPELVQQWVAEIWHEGTPVRVALSDEHIANRAAQWGADQELEVCVRWLDRNGYFDSATELLAARRPKPPTLKEQALEALREAESTGCLYVNGRSDLIRKALETLP